MNEQEWQKRLRQMRREAEAWLERFHATEPVEKKKGRPKRRSLKSGARSQEPEARSLKAGARSRKPEARRKA